MMLNDECRMVNDPYREERLAIAAAQQVRRTNER
jgi:hypothetical protein